MAAAGSVVLPKVLCFRFVGIVGVIGVLGIVGVIGLVGWLACLCCVSGCWLALLAGWLAGWVPG